MKSFEAKKFNIDTSKIIFLIFIFAAALSFTVFRPGYSVYIDGEKVATVKNDSEFENILNEANRYIEDISGESAVIDSTPSYLFKIIPKTAYTAPEKIRDNLITLSGNIVKCCEITADGISIAYAKDKKQAETAVKNIIDSYNGDNKKLLTKIEYAPKYIPKYELYPQNSLTSALENNIQIETTQTSIDETEIPFEVIEEKNNAMDEGTTQVLQEGATGKMSVSLVHTLINGVKTGSKIISQTVLQEPTAQVLSVGTKPVLGIATGTLMKPINGGVISSRFGARDGRRSSHKGIDVACQTGTSVLAADGGVCEASEYRSDYGYLIIIDHRNGYKTYYAHLSELAVSAGEKLKKGQLIGKTGNTGISTGPHLHFEVRKNDVPCNPDEFIKLGTGR